MPAEAVTLFPEKHAERAAKVSDRRTPELVFAFVGPVGSGVSTAASIVKETLEGKFKYEVMPIIKISRIIDQEAHRVGEKPSLGMSGAVRILHLQDVGNKLREMFGSDYLAKKAVESIAERRHKDGYDKIKSDSGAVTEVPVVKRRAYIIDSVKNHAELSLLSEIYKDMFWVIGIFAPNHVREHRMGKDGVAPAEIRGIMDRDENEEADFGQKVRKVFAKSDFFIRNDRETETSIRSTINRYLEIIFFSGIHTPNEHESAMYEAASVASKSACMSRQVGAAIVDSSGELLSVGWNDVPKFGGGLCSEDDQGGATPDADFRCFRWGKKICHNDYQKERILNEVHDRLSKAKLLKRGTKPGDILAVIKGSGVSSLIEFSRAVHAEMEAMLAVARGGRGNLVGALLYTTTFPCHNCARHIVAAGISRVYFIEPYPKSLAHDLHPDSIALDERESAMVVFAQYEGVAPKNVFKLFQHGRDRKRDGKVVDFDPAGATPVYQPFLDSFTLYEDKIVEELVQAEGTAST